MSPSIGLAVARDFKGKRDRVVAVINNETTMAGQVYEAMSNAGYLDSNMIVILNDSQHSLHPKLEEASKTPINALSSTLSKLQSSKLFRRFRELAKVCPCYIYKRILLSTLTSKELVQMQNPSYTYMFHKYYDSSNIFHDPSSEFGRKANPIHHLF